uniref:FLYWCH-type domain-containing protein n=1 Tax=Ditylenchus dipsaci TaxID=166011 RepID=A0A915EJ99_9BILA
MSSNSENEEVSYMARHPIDHEEVSRTGKRVIWVNDFSYTFRSVVSAKIEGLKYFCCNRKRTVVNGQKKDCKGKGFARNSDRYFYVTKDHFHNSKVLEFEKKQRLARGMNIVEASPTTKTKSALRVVKRGAGRDLLAVLPKDSSVKRQLQ